MANYLFPRPAGADRLSGVRRNAARPAWETARDPGCRFRGGALCGLFLVVLT